MGHLYYEDIFPIEQNVWMENATVQSSSQRVRAALRSHLVMLLGFKSI
jgi:hypothetical protein